MKLYLNTSDFTIESDDGVEISQTQAEKFVRLGFVTDCNLAFARWTNQCDFNMNSLKEYYETS